MLHWTVWLIKINNFNMRTPICTVACNKFPCIITFTFFNTSNNEWIEEFVLSGMDLIKIEAEIRLKFLFLLYCKNKAYFHNCLCESFKPSQILFSVEGYFGENLQDVKLQVWLDKIWRKTLQDLFYDISSFRIDLY